MMDSHHRAAYAAPLALTSRNSLGDHRLDRLAGLIDDPNRPLGRGLVLLRVVDRHQLANGGQEVLGVRFAVLDRGTFLVRPAEGGPALHATAHHEQAPGPRVVVAARLGAAGADVAGRPAL